MSDEVYEALTSRVPFAIDPFTEAARAYARERYPSGTDLDRDRRMVVDEFAVWAREHLAAQDEAAIRSLAATTVHTGQDIVEAAQIMRDVAQEPTDAEVEAAARALHTALYAVHETEWEELGKAHRDRWADTARAALTAARAAGRDAR